MPKPYIAAIGKTIRFVTRLRGGGSAFPGLVIEKIDPSFTRNILLQLPKGVVIVSGTNGKTTTTKMVVELLESQGLKVFTNRTGSNFARGVTAALLAEVDFKGRLDADIAVLELDEAHAVRFVDTIPPTYSLLLNVMRDQLDRFGEIDATAHMLEHIAHATTKSVILNREDPRVAAITPKAPSVSKHFFGLASSLLTQFPSDDTMRSPSSAPSSNTADVILESFSGEDATFQCGDQRITTTLKLRGIYNIFNAAAAIALTRVIMAEKFDIESLTTRLSAITPAFGRGESLMVDGQPVELVLVKNPGGFRLALESFSPRDYATMIAINDNYADGRDMSWLWDVDFTSLSDNGVAMISGVRAYDMALRLQYEEVNFTNIEQDIPKALSSFLTSKASMPKRIYCTYTAMLALRKELAKITTMERVL